MVRVSTWLTVGLLVGSVLGCERKGECPTCGTVVIAAIGEPSSIFPPLTYETVGRDIGDLIYERLASLRPRRATIDPQGYAPGLAASWEAVDSLTWRFRLRPGARWHDGRPVTPEDIQYSFEIFRDSVVDALARSELSSIAQVEAADSATVLIRFTHPYAEQLYDATYHVRIIPKHIWALAGPKENWPTDTTVSRLIGSGPYRFSTWQRGQSLILIADSVRASQPEIKRVIWRFTGDAEAAANLVLSHEADLLETVGLASAERLARDSAYQLIPYASASYGLIGFRLGGDRRRPADQILADRAVRRALVQAVDRATVARAVFGPETKVPPGPISQLLWIWDTRVETLAYDTIAAAAALDASGWRRSAGGTRVRGGRPLRIEILVPSTSTPRRRAAEAVQEQWKAAGIEGVITLVDLPVMQERLGRGNFDAYVGAWLDEPSARGLAGQWTRAGWSDLNYGHYFNPAVDSLLAAAARTGDPGEAKSLYLAALNGLNADAPAMFLFAPTNLAAVSRRLDQVTINPYSWLSTLPEWRLRSEED